MGVGALLVALIAAPVVLLSFLVLRIVSSDVTERATAERQKSVDLGARLIASRLDGTGSILQSVAGRTTLRDALRSSKANDLYRHVNYMKTSADGYSAAVAFDSRGILLASDPPGPDAGRDFSTRDYFIGAIASPRPYMSEAFATAAGGPGPVAVAVSLAVHDEGGVLGVILLGFLPQEVIKSLSPLEAVNGRTVLIVDQRGRVIASTDPTYSPLATIDLPGLDLGGLERSGSAQFSDGHIDRVLTYSRIPGSAWNLLVLDDEAVLLAAQYRVVETIVIAVIAAVVAAGIIGVVLTVLYAILARQRRELATTNLALVAANERLDQTARAKSAFLANISHELRTPLNAIIGFSELLEERAGASIEERYLAWVRNIQGAGRHLLALINDVLDMSRVEVGHLEIYPEHIALADLLAPVLETACQDTAARGLTFDALDAPQVTVLLDPLRTRQVLFNLLSNAAKFTERGGHVRFTTEVHGSELRFVVSDTGIGIDRAAQDRIFNSFERFHEGSHEAPGTGLGLALTKQIVERQGGGITFESEAGVGTSFTVSFPDAVHTAIVGPRILIVEDERNDAALVAALATEIGLTVELATTGASALTSIRNDPPTAVVLDLRLPDMRGEELLRTMKTNDATRGVPVLVVTIEDDEGRTQLLGAVDHLTKPIQHERLLDWLGSFRA